MDEQQGRHPEDDADDLLRRALIDPDASVAVALKVRGLALADALTVVFHGRADLGTIQTYVAHGPLGAGSAVSADALLRVPCDLDLGDAGSRDEAEEAYVEQARTLRDALVAADTVLAIWQEPLSELAEGKVAVSRSIELGVRLPAHRLMPVALLAPDRHLTIAPVCGARTLAEGRAPRARPSPHDRAGGRRAAAGGGPPADGHRVRPAGRRARLPAARRPRALPRGLRRARRRPCPPDGRAPRAPGRVGAAIHRALRRRGRAAGPARLAPGRPARTTLPGRCRAVPSSCSPPRASLCSSRSRSCSRATSTPRARSAARCSRCSRRRRGATRPRCSIASTAARATRAAHGRRARTRDA